MTSAFGHATAFASLVALAAACGGATSEPSGDAGSTSFADAAADSTIINGTKCCAPGTGDACCTADDGSACGEVRAACGDGTCDGAHGENRCNCAKDCP